MPLFNPVPAATQTVTGTVLLPAASVNYKPSSPTSTSSTTMLMMGLGSTCVYTPSGSGKVIADVAAVVIATVAATGASVNGYFGALAAAAGTTVAAGSNGGEISQIGNAGWTTPSQGVLAVASTAGWATSGTLWVAASGSTVGQVTYTGVSGNTFTGCAYVAGSATGTVATGGAVTPYPQNGSAVAGTQFSATQTTRITATSATIGTSVSLTDRLSLTAGQAYWFDLGLDTNTANDTVQLINISMTLAEQLT